MQTELQNQESFHNQIQKWQRDFVDQDNMWLLVKATGPTYREWIL